MAIKDMINASVPGASSTLNSTLGKVGSLKDSAQAQFSDVTADASAMKSAVEGQAASLVGDLSSMIPPLPELPNLNAQGAFAGLADIDINSISGASSVADLKTSSGETLSAQGIDVDSIVSQVKKTCQNDLSKVKSCIKLTGYVNSSDDFIDQPKVINGAS